MTKYQQQKQEKVIWISERASGVRRDGRGLYLMAPSTSRERQGTFYRVGLEWKNGGYITTGCECEGASQYGAKCIHQLGAEEKLQPVARDRYNVLFDACGIGALGA